MFELLWSVFLIWLGFALARSVESRREERAIRSHIDALGMEILSCGRIAANFLSENIQAPLYRLPNDAYSIALPLLLREGLIGGNQADVLQRFYLQVEQVNRGLDNVDDFLRGKVPESDEQRITLALEERRLKLKAEEMRSHGHGHDASELYKAAFSVIEAIFSAWENRSWWRRFFKKHIKPNQERLRQRWRTLQGRWRR